MNEYINYECAYKDLVEYILAKSDDQDLLDKIQEMDSKHDYRYTCIKDYVSSEGKLLFKKGEKYAVLEQDNHFIYVEYKPINSYDESFTYEEFEEYFSVD